MKRLVWSRTAVGSWNAKIGPVTFFVLAWHKDEQVWYVHPKLPGIKSVTSTCEGTCRLLAEELYARFLESIGGKR